MRGSSLTRGLCGLIRSVPTQPSPVSGVQAAQAITSLMLCGVHTEIKGGGRERRGVGVEHMMMKACMQSEQKEDTEKE